MGPSTCTAVPVAFYLQPPGPPPHVNQQQFVQQQMEVPSRTGTPDLLTAPTTYQGSFVAGQHNYPYNLCVQHPQHGQQQGINVGIGGPSAGAGVIPPFQVEQLPSRPGSPDQIEFDHRMGMQHHAGGSSPYVQVPVVRLPPAMSSGTGGVYTTNSNLPPNQPMDFSTSGSTAEPLVPGLQHQHLIAPVPLRGVVDPTDGLQMVHRGGGVGGTKSSVSGGQHAVGGPSPSSGGSTTPARTTPSPDFALAGAGATEGSPTTVSQHQSPHAHWGKSSSSTNNKKSPTQPPTPPPMHPAPTFLPSTSAGPSSGGRIIQYEKSEEPEPDLSPYEATRRAKQVPLLLDVLVRGEKSANADEAAATKAEIQAQQEKVFAAVGMLHQPPGGGSSGRIDYDHFLSDID